MLKILSRYCHARVTWDRHVTVWLRNGHGKFSKTVKPLKAVSCLRIITLNPYSKILHKGLVASGYRLTWKFGLDHIHKPFWKLPCQDFCSFVFKKGRPKTVDKYHVRLKRKTNCTFSSNSSQNVSCLFVFNFEIWAIREGAGEKIVLRICFKQN